MGSCCLPHCRSLEMLPGSCSNACQCLAWHFILYGHLHASCPRYQGILCKQCEVCYVSCLHIPMLSMCLTQMTHYEEDDKGIILHFDRGQPSVHAKVLVGADGYFSRVRAQCLDDGPPTFNVSSLLLLKCSSAHFYIVNAFCTKQQRIGSLQVC